jgi:hypothetical protein
MLLRVTCRLSARATLRVLAWTAPLLLYGHDACAWGLYTHVYFGQLLLWAIPLLDARFSRAVRRFPGLCLAGVCLPDVSLFAAVLEAPALRATHQWSSAARMLHAAHCDEHRAMALGYASHLLADVVAHNHFVPAHERLWLRAPVLAHAACEWAMDAHVAPHVFAAPARLLSEHGRALADYGAGVFRLEPAAAHGAIRCLMLGEAALRASPVPALVYCAARRADRALPARFDHYVRQTAERLRQINRLVAGEIPARAPEIAYARQRAALPGATRRHCRPTLPDDWSPDAARR